MAKLGTTEDGRVGPTQAGYERLLRTFGRALRLDINTALPGKVQVYKPGVPGKFPPLADVQPAFKVAYQDEGKEVVEPMAPIPSCVVQFPEYGDYVMMSELKKGQTGLVVISQRSLDVWMRTGGVVDPGADHTHQLTDGIFIPGVWSGPSQFTQAPPPGGFVLMRKDGTAKIEMDAAGNLTTTGLTNTMKGTTKSTMDAPLMEVGANATEPMVLGQALVNAITNTIAAGVPIANDGGANLKATMATFWATQVATVLSTVSKVK